jgi:hypothetical protein
MRRFAPQLILRICKTLPYCTSAERSTHDAQERTTGTSASECTAMHGGSARTVCAVLPDNELLALPQPSHILAVLERDAVARPISY